MPQPITNVGEYCLQLVRSQLLTGETVASLEKKWRSGLNGAMPDVDSFRKYLVATQHLTEYQAVMVQRGHADGFQIGGYTILGRIVKGVSAGVYHARHQSGQIVALKVLPTSKARNPNVLARFQREGRLLTQLDHPNIVRAFQLGNSGGIHYIAMEFLEGITLDGLLAKRRQLPVSEACRIVVQLLNGLQHLHETRMIHRDVKPANIMITGSTAETTLQATVKLLDIGLGRELFAEDAPKPDEIHLTREGAILGTPDYLPPEQARNARQADIRSDLYSAGCVLYQCLAGRPPFTESNLMAQMVKHATETPDPLTAFVPDLPAGLQAVVDRMLAKNPNDRYATPNDAIQALTPFLPRANVPAATTSILPTYDAWLQSEEHLVPATPDLAGNEVAIETAPFEAAAEAGESPEIAAKPAPASGGLSRRDWLMLAIGFSAALGAVALGYVLAQLTRNIPAP